jgi:hypothetical protein
VSSSSGSPQSTIAVSIRTSLLSAFRAASSSASPLESVASTSAPARAAAMLGRASPQPSSTTRSPPSAIPSISRARATPLRHRTNQYGATGAPLDFAVIREFGGLPRLEQVDLPARQLDRPADDLLGH